MARRSFRLAVVLGIASAVLALGTLVAVSGAAPSAAAWIDKPLSGSSVPLGPVAVVAHATDAAGIELVELTIDGTSPTTVDVPDPAPLVSAEFTWEQIDSGVYALGVRGRSTDGTWGPLAVAFVTVSDIDPTPSASEGQAGTPDPSASASGAAVANPSPRATPRPTAAATSRPGPTPRVTPVPTPRPTPRPTPVLTPRPTPVPCTPPAPLLTAPADGAVIRDPALNPPTFRWAYRDPPGCAPSGFRIQVFRGPDLGQLVQDVTLPAVYAWAPSGDLADCTIYSWRVAARRGDGAIGAWSAPSTFELFIGRCP
jgi:hypothetical protein